jgi:hypothetical protein
MLLLLTPFAAQADQPRWKSKFTSQNGRYELQWIDGIRDKQKWKLIEKKSAEQLYEFEAEDLGSMTVLVSDDGLNLITVDDWSQRQASDELDVLSFYRQGKIIKRYTLKEILNSTDNIQRSASHFSWFFKSDDLVINDSKFRLTTFELTNYTFDTTNGEILKKERDPILSEDTLYIYGKIKELGNGLYEMKVCHVVQGEIPTNGYLNFRVEKDKQNRMWNYVTVIIRDGKLLALKPVTFNSCNYERKQRLPSK